MSVLAHVSDLHATPVRVERVADFLGKRALGLLSWRLRRARAHRPEVLEALAADLAAAPPDQVVVTGDLTNVACEHEFPEARAWLERLGPAERVFAVPGNHDAYVRIARQRSWDLWSEYLASDPDVSEPGFPTLRVRGRVAIVGTSSAVPSARRALLRIAPESCPLMTDQFLSKLASCACCTSSPFLARASTTHTMRGLAS